MGVRLARVLRTGHRILYLSIRYFERVQAVALSDGTDGRAGEAAGCVACPPRPRLPARFPSRRARRDWQASPSFTTLAEFVTLSAAGPPGRPRTVASAVQPFAGDVRPSS